MTRASVSRFCLLTASLYFLGVPQALAQSPGPVVAGTCAVLDKSCGQIDTTFVLKTFSVAFATGAGFCYGPAPCVATLITCTGTTKIKPEVEKTCRNEGLYPPFDANPKPYTLALFPCNVLLGTTSASNDDWVEHISPSGDVTYACEIGGNDVN
jgi:hypothetical protein